MKKMIQKLKKSFRVKKHTEKNQPSKQQLDAKVEKGTQKAISQYRATFQILTDFDKD
jgi:hypothetical protein